MPRTKISEFSTTAGDNTDIDGINIAEGCAPSGINDAIRELMAQLKDFQSGDAGDPITVVGTLAAKGTSSSGADLKLYEDTDNGTNYVGFIAPASIAANVQWTLPNADGTVNQALVTNGTGTLSFASMFSTGSANTFTAAQTFRAANAIRSEAASTQDAMVVAGRAGGTSSYAVTLIPNTLSANRTATFPDATTTVVGTDVTQTLTNKRIDPRVSSTASTASITPDISSFDQYAVTAQAAALAINAPTGTPVDGNKLVFRLLDNGTARALTWDATYTAIGVTLPTTTTVSKTTYVGCIYNANNTRWDVVAVTTQA